MRALFAVFLLSFSFLAHGLPKWIDSTHALLLPKEVSEPLTATTQFPLFWWNFLVVEIDDLSWNQLDGFCKTLNVKAKDLINKSACGEDLTQYREIVSDWAADQSRREDPPSEAQLQLSLKEALSKASLPTDAFFLSVLRQDPLSSYRKLQAMLDARVQLKFEKKHGFFFDPETHRVVLPIQLAFPPASTEPTARFFGVVDESLPKSGGVKYLGAIGPHASTLINERQIHQDVHIISIAGAALLILQIGIAVLIGRWRLLLLAPPVILSTLLAAVITYLIFGSVHGLTLAFGPGIIGLAMDHGLHSCLNTQWKGAWRANWYGLLTTVVALFAMLFSSIPFLRQLMAFSIIGLFLGFATYWWLHRHYTRLFEVAPLNIERRARKSHFVFVALTFIGLIAGLVCLRPTFGMQQMNYQTAEDFELTKWFFFHLKSKSPLLQVYGEKDQSPLQESLRQQAYAHDNHLQVENVAAYIPGVEAQSANIQKWLKFCPGVFSPEEKTFFQPFWKNICEDHDVKNLISSVPSYLKDFHVGDKWISLWLIENSEDTAKVKAFHPAAKSLPEIVDLFQTLLEKETAWMAPLSILLATFLLWFYYRQWRLVALSLVPFFVGIGLFFGVAVIFGFHLSFISLIALLMIFGLSLDYGIFATNLYTGLSGPSTKGVWTSVVLAAIVTFLGFLPLIFCRHPVLVHLGQALVFGTAGTILGSMWGVPCLAQLFSKKDFK